MTVFLTVVHVLVCLILIVTVLLQRGRGAEIGAVFGGGGSSTVFGSRGAGSFLSRLTTGAAAVFFATSLTLAILGSGHSGSVFGEPPPPAEEPKGGGFEEVPPAAAPAEAPTAESGAAAAPSAAPETKAAEPAPAVPKPAPAETPSAPKSKKK